MAKMYYSEEETCQKLGITPDELMEKFVNTAKLQMYQDGANHVYKSSDVDALAGPAEEAPAGDLGIAPEEDIVVDEDAINLADLDDATAEISAPGKEDTVITSEGISIFDDEDLQLEPAEALGSTAAPSLNDDVALDGVGSGSGLLDLTRESDETSLGADLDMLDNLDMEGMAGSGLGSGLGDMGDIDVSMSTTAAPTMMEAPTFVESVDSSSGFFTGLLVGASAAIIICLLAAVVVMTGGGASFLETLQENIMMVAVGLAVVSVAAGGIGAFVGKAFQGR